MNIAVEETSTALPVKLTDRAAARIAKLLSEGETATALRIGVEGGGCSGFQYQFDFVDRVEADDLVIRKGGAVVVVDPISLPYMAGSEIDFVSNLMGESLQVNNPLAVSSCGCGTSFAV
ncbi:MAG: iron-sulfur cluster insertion protein ErpA [Bauldia sp.]